MEASAFGGVSWRRFVEASAFCESVLVRLTRMAFCGHSVPFRSVLRAFGGGVSRMGFVKDFINQDMKRFVECFVEAFPSVSSEPRPSKETKTTDAF